MKSFMLHFARYMATYAALMLASYLVWTAAGSPVDAAAALAAGPQASALLSVSNFLMNFALIAYPAYALIAAAIGHAARRIPPRAIRVGARTHSGAKPRALFGK